MPLYNKAHLVGETIESLLAQTYGEWRLYVVDDGSADDGPAVVERFRDDRITVLRQTNSGPAPARNAGIAAGSADWIAFLDADDVWLPHHLEELSLIRAQFPRASLLGTAYRPWDGASRGPIASPEKDRFGLIRYFDRVASGRQPFFTSSAAFSRAAASAVGPLVPVMMGDETDFWARLALHGPVAASSRITVLYRVETGGLTDIYMSSPEPDRPPPSTISEVSPALATLARAMGGIGDEQLRRDIDAYMDYELGIALLRAVRLNEIAYARGLLPLFRGRPRGKAGVAARLAALPPPAGQWLLRTIFKAKRLARSAGLAREGR